MQLPPLETWQYILLFVLLAVPILPNLWSIWHAYNRAFPTEPERLLWILLAVFIPVLGGLAYIIFGVRRSRKISAALSDKGNTSEQETS